MCFVTSHAPDLGATTTTLLLDSLKDESNHGVWVGFDERYRPILRGVARRLGLSAEDAADVAQETLFQFVRDYRLGKYVRGQGRLRTWVLSIARHRAIDMLRARRRETASGASDLAETDLPTASAAEAAWELEAERAIYQQAYSELLANSKTEPHTVELYKLVAERGISNEAAARECGVSVEQARLANHRMTKRLQAIVANLTASYETDQ